MQFFKLSGSKVKAFDKECDSHAENKNNNFQKSLVMAARRIKFFSPDENWAPRRVSAIKTRV